MRKFALLTALMLVFALIGAACGDDGATTSTTTVAPTTTSTTATTTTTTTMTVPILTGILVLTPEGCETCDALVARLEELARGEVPIEVRVEGDRPAVRVFDTEGVMTAEWRGAENTVYPTHRATAENAEAIVMAACDAIGTCSPETTTTTTKPELNPNDFVCGMEVERRYNFDGTRPAPLGVIWGRFLSTEDANVLSGILMGYGRNPDDPTAFADFCFGDRDDDPITVRFWLNTSIHAIEIGVGNSTGQDLLFFGNSPEARLAVHTPRQVNLEFILDEFVVGRQYVFEIDRGACDLQDPPCSNAEVIDYLLSRRQQEPRYGIIMLWYGPTGSI
jgi:hypothetical protein